MQNKPNSLNVQIYITIYETKDYKNLIPLAGQKNKPNSNPIAERVKLTQSMLLQKITKKNVAKGYEKQSQNKPNFFKCQNERKYLYHKGL